MAHHTAEDFRKLVNTLNEYMTSVTEDDSVPDETSEPIDKMMTTPAGAEKVSGELDTQSLIKTLNIPSNLQSDFKSAIEKLQSSNPQFDPGQALAIATAFANISKPGANPNGITEGESSEDDSDATPVDMDTVQKTLLSASESSPVAKLQATKLVKHITDGIRDRSKNGGGKHIMNGVVAALEAAENGNEAQALQHIHSMVNRVEGDTQAADADAFPKIVVSLMLLAGDLLQRNKQ